MACGRRVICIVCRRDRYHAARGLCTTCHKRAAREGRLDAYPMLPRLRPGARPAAEHYEDYVFLIETGRAQTKRQAAEQLGLKFKTLGKAITRHRARMRLTNVEQLSSV